MKELARNFLRRLGFEPTRYSTDKLLEVLLKNYNQLRLNPNDIKSWILLPPRFASLCYLKQLLQINEIDLIIDVGANRGQFALDTRNLGYTGEIISFEPIPKYQEYLSNLSANDPMWKIIPYALGSKSSKEELKVYKDDSFSSLHEVNNFGHDTFGKFVELDRVEIVHVRTLDEVAGSLGINSDRKILLKTDTQGHDAEVIKGGEQTLNYVLGILTEATVKPLYDECVTFKDLSKILLSMGFVYGGMFPISYMPDTLELIELDCYFIRKT